MAIAKKHFFKNPCYCLAFRALDGIFESEKLGTGKKSVAINFVFNALDKTLTDVEIDTMMKKLIQIFEKNIQAEIRK
jgi:phenylalanyl-tRNA synthetase beta subunit